MTGHGEFAKTDVLRGPYGGDVGRCHGGWQLSQTPLPKSALVQVIRTGTTAAVCGTVPSLSEANIGRIFAEAPAGGIAA